jgi:DNA-binding transcriptional ArsR family regulator
LIKEKVVYIPEQDDVAEERLDRAFAALADPVRRAIIARLSRGPAGVNELAEPFRITKQAVSRHIAVLEQAGLVTRTREAQRRPVHLDAARLEALTAWIDRYRLIHEQQFRRLDALLDRATAGPTSAPMPTATPTPTPTGAATTAGATSKEEQS